MKEFLECAVKADVLRLGVVFSLCVTVLGVTIAGVTNKAYLPILGKLSETLTVGALGAVTGAAAERIRNKKEEEAPSLEPEKTEGSI